MLEIHHSGREPSICSYIMRMYSRICMFSYVVTVVVIVFCLFFVVVVCYVGWCIYIDLYTCMNTNVHVCPYISAYDAVVCHTL